VPRLAASRRQAAVCAPRLVVRAAARYARHAPERTLVYALVEAHYPDFLARLEAEDRCLPAYVREEFDAYLRCGVLEHARRRGHHFAAAVNGHERDSPDPGPN
jgi:hypothetical protein